MFRFIAGCVAVAALCVGAVLLLGKGFPETVTWATGAKTGGEGDPPPKIKERPQPGDEPAKRPSTDADSPKPAPAANDDGPVVQVLIDSKSSAQPLIVPEARILATQRQEVPSRRDGELLFLATPVQAGEIVPKSKRLEYEVPTLAVKVTEAVYSKLPENEKLIDVDDPVKRYRAVRPFKDGLEPGSTFVIRQKLVFRKLEVGDRVSEGQLLGVINPALAIEELFIRQAGTEMAAKEVEQSDALAAEYVRRVAGMDKLMAKTIGAVTLDDYGAAKATVLKYKAEGEAKRAGVLKTQRELSQALTTLHLHQIRASIDGVIKTVYKQPGEAVKALDQVLQIQNPKDLRVEAQVEIQDALALRDRLEQARKWRDDARKWRQKGDERNAAACDAEAARLLAVYVEASRIEPPRALLTGHLQEVTCVAVSGGAVPRIVSGSEDQTVRVWQRGEERWEEKARLDHRAAVRAVACTAPESKKHLLLTGTATGRGRLFDLDKLGDAKEIPLAERHSGAITAAAFSANGELCATGGEDRSICVWDAADGRLLGRLPGAHNNSVTSLSFTADGRLISAGKDRRLVVWDVAKDGETYRLTESASFGRRSGEVPQIGGDQAGNHVLFDEGREVRVLSLKTRKIEGVLANAPGVPNFATLALYSPDGSTILTNGNAPGRLQLWRAPSAKNRAAELRNFAWSSGAVTCGAFDPSGKFAATGTSDHRVLVWEMPARDEAEKGQLEAQLSYVEEFLDASLRRVAVRATLENPGWIIPGGSATLVVPPRAAR